MSQILLLAAAAFIVYAVLNIWRRPGLFASVFLLTYGLAIFLGSIGPIAGLLALIAGAAAINSDQIGQTILWPEYFFLLWIGIQILSLFTTPQIAVTLPYVASSVLLAGGSYLYARAFATRPGFFEDLLLGSIVVTTLSSFQILRTAKVIQVLGESEGFSHVGLAVMPELCLVGVIAFLIFHRGQSWILNLVILGFTFGLLLPMAVALGTRSIVLSIGIALVILLGFRIIRGGAARIVLTTLGAMAALAAGLALLWLQFAETPLGRIAAAGGSRLITGVASGDLDVDKSSLIRLQLYQEAWDLFAQAPLFGSGAGSFGYLADNANGAYPHNMFLEMAVQSGVIGVAIFLAFCIPLAMKGFTAMLRRPLPWGLAFATAMFISAFVRHQVSMSITQGKLLFFALGCFAAFAIHERRSGSLTDAGTTQIGSTAEADAI